MFVCVATCQLRRLVFHRSRQRRKQKTTIIKSARPYVGYLQVWWGSSYHIYHITSNLVKFSLGTGCCSLKDMIVVERNYNYEIKINNV